MSAAAVSAAVWVATFISCYDGDTCKMRVEVWPDITVETNVRLRGIDAPEIASKCATERVLARAARDDLSALLANAVMITLTNVEADKYGGRVLADVRSDGIQVGVLLIEAGLARPYAGGSRLSWC